MFFLLLQFGVYKKQAFGESMVAYSFCKICVKRPPGCFQPRRPLLHCIYFTSMPLMLKFYGIAKLFPNIPPTIHNADNIYNPFRLIWQIENQVIINWKKTDTHTMPRLLLIQMMAQRHIIQTPDSLHNPPCLICGGVRHTQFIGTSNPTAPALNIRYSSSYAKISFHFFFNKIRSVNLAGFYIR